MNTKICDGCGWEYAITYKPRKCKFCKTPFSSGLCSRCGEIGQYSKKYPKANVCKKCVNEYSREYRLKNPLKVKMHAENTKLSFIIKQQKWLLQMRDIPFKALTDEEWRAACRYFKGCAFCNASEISARSYFIPFQLGGKYTAMNIVPSCEACASKLYMKPPNFFKILPKAQLEKITTYLQEVIDAQRGKD